MATTKGKTERSVLVLALLKHFVLETLLPYLQASRMS